MILQALNQYYVRMGDTLAPEGWIDKPIDYVVRLDRDGNCLDVLPPPIAKGKRRERGAIRRVPNIGKQALKHTNSGNDPNLLWDNSAFVLGVGKDGRKKRASFIDAIADYFDGIDDPGVNAVARFLGVISAKATALETFLSRYPDYRKDLESGQPTISFQLSNDPSDMVCQRTAVRTAYEAMRSKASDVYRGQCLVTGELDAIEETHSVIKGVWGGKTSGGSVVAFNKRAFESYGKDERQGLNSPVGKHAASAYTTALNHLLRPGSRQRLQVGDASTVFWTQEPDEMEDRFRSIFGGSDDPNHTDELRAVLKAIHSGKFDGGRGDNRFFVLGLAPNAARISVRFWHAEPLRSIAERIRQWFDDIEIGRGKSEPQYLSLKRLLTSVCLATKERPYGDIERLPPSIGGDVARAIFSGGELPAALLSAALHRCRAEQAKKDDKIGKPVRHVSYARAAVIKAWLNRHYRIHMRNQKEIAVSLDKSNTHAPYVLGRLFATFERMQESAAERELNRTIRDSFFGAAMATPRSVFPRLVRLNQTHLRDLKRGRPGSGVYFDKLVREINDKLDPKIGFPGSFNLMEQGVFAIGYYHQRHDLFPKSSALATSQSNSTSISTTEGN